MKIYCAKNMNGDSKLFKSPEVMARWFTDKKPVNNEFYVKAGIVGEVKVFKTITSKNLQAAMAESKALKLNASIFIAIDFGCFSCEEQYILSEIDVIE